MKCAVAALSTSAWISAAISTLSKYLKFTCTFNVQLWKVLTFWNKLVEHLKHLKHLKHLNTLKCPSFKHFQVLNRFSMNIVIFWLNHKHLWGFIESAGTLLYFLRFSNCEANHSLIWFSWLIFKAKAFKVLKFFSFFKILTCFADWKLPLTSISINFFRIIDKFLLVIS